MEQILRSLVEKTTKAREMRDMRDSGYTLERSTAHLYESGECTRDGITHRVEFHDTNSGLFLRLEYRGVEHA